jgi:hypothetical protein
MCDGLVDFLDTVKAWVVIFRLCIYLIVEFYTVIPNNNVWDVSILFIIVYYESIKRELKIKPISECRCDERLIIYYGLLTDKVTVRVKGNT